jgi:hypothetical protein
MGNTPSTIITVRVAPRVGGLVDALARREGCTRSALLRRLLGRAIEQLEETNR